MKIVGLLMMCLACASVKVAAQLWGGGLGDPVMDITFGFGSNPGQPLVNTQTSLRYSTRACPTAGEYSVLNLTFACFGNAWHTLSGDHTPLDGGGYYMLINAADNASDIFVYKVNNLCPNTRYQFSTWIKNALRPTSCDRNGVKPNLTFTVETTAGVVLHKYNSGDIPSSEDPQWNQLGTTFTTDSNPGDYVLRITNSAPAGCGNAFAIDDIQLAPCGPLLTASISNNGLDKISVCQGSNERFVLTTGSAAAFIAPDYQWQILGDGSIWQNIEGGTTNSVLQQPVNAGVYTYRCTIKDGMLTANQCRIATNLLFVEVLRAPFVQATNYVYGCLGGDVTLQASGATNYSWTGPNGFSSQSDAFLLPKVQYSDGGLYKVTGTTGLGCTNSDSTFLRVFPNATATSSQGSYICEGSSIQLSASGGFRYQWEPAIGLSSDTASNPVASPEKDSRYTVKVTNEFGCTDTASIDIKIWKKPIADAGADRKVRLGIPAVLNARANGTDVSWYWSPSNSLMASRSLSPQVNPTQTTTYKFNVVSPHGCGTSTDEVSVKVFDKIYVPNAFSPNGDGINDTWYVEPLDLFTDAETVVYNRYGQVVYKTTGYNTPWNGLSAGKPLPIGTYYYVIDLRVKNEPRLTGSVTILR